MIALETTLDTPSSASKSILSAARADALTRARTSWIQFESLLELFMVVRITSSPCAGYDVIEATQDSMVRGWYRGHGI